MCRYLYPKRKKTCLLLAFVRAMSFIELQSYFNNLIDKCIIRRTYNETTDANSRRHSRGRPWASQGRQNWRV